MRAVKGNVDACSQLYVMHQRAGNPRFGGVNNWDWMVVGRTNQDALGMDLYPWTFPRHAITARSAELVGRQLVLPSGLNV